MAKTKKPGKYRPSLSTLMSLLTQVSRNHRYPSYDLWKKNPKRVQRVKELEDQLKQLRRNVMFQAHLQKMNAVERQITQQKKVKDTSTTIRQQAEAHMRQLRLHGVKPKLLAEITQFLDKYN